MSFRRRALVGLEVLEHVELFYRLEGDKPVVLRLNPAAALGVEERLRTSTLPYQYQTEQDERRVVRYGLFQVQPHISANVRFEADYRQQLVQVTLRNVDRFESVSLEFGPGQAHRGRARGPREADDGRTPTRSCAVRRWRSFAGQETRARIRPARVAASTRLRQS